MFEALLAVRNRPAPQDDATLEAAGDAHSRDVLRLVREWERLPFAEEIRDVVSATDRRELLARLLDREQLGYASLPKGLIPFHRYPGGARTALEEQLVECAAYAADGSGRGRQHFTVTPEHRGAIERHVASACERIEAVAGIAVDYSVQSPATDTLAGTADGEPLRDGTGALVLRPGGHGALIENLGGLGADLVYIKNVDNVAPEHRTGPTRLWKTLIGGVLVRLEAEVHSKLRAWDERRPDVEELNRLEAFAASRLGVRLPEGPARDDARRERLRGILERPIRVCGMVRNEGEPGGGPFWVREADGRETLQIVESSQVDLSDPGQAAALAAATHFNPVDLVCAVRDYRGQPHRLAEFVDPDAGFRSTKSRDGETLLALERPGLWNGAMSRWSTVFVEVPVETFTPVKTVLDLLRAEHQPG
jgi:hypothetical protein